MDWLIIGAIFIILLAILVLKTMYVQAKRKQPVWFTFTAIFSIITTVLYYIFNKKK